MEEINCMPLTHLKTDGKASIVRINTNDRQILRKLAAFGMLPGMEVSVVQKYPAIVIKIGYTQVALDKKIAAKIIVTEQS